MESVIYFYDAPSRRISEENLFLSNFFESPFTVDGKTYRTVEHYFQSQKFLDPEIQERIRNAKSPVLAKKLGRKFTLRENWNSFRNRVMAEALKHKFEQNDSLREKLINTGDAILVENSPRDRYWGGALPGSKNKLGLMLMELRSKLKET